MDETPPCKTDPRAPHGFDRNASHSADRYVCECEGWEPPKEWVGLTDEERHEIREWQEIQEELGPVWAPMMLYLYLAIEAKLKEKNCGSKREWVGLDDDIPGLGLVTEEFYNGMLCAEDILRKRNT